MARLKSKEKVGVASRLRLPQLVDELGELRDQIAALQEKEKELKEALMDNVAPGEKVVGKVYQATIIEATKIVWDTDKVVQTLPKKTLKEVVKVTADIKNYLTPDKLEKVVAETRTETRVRVSRRRSK